MNVGTGSSMGWIGLGWVVKLQFLWVSLGWVKLRPVMQTGGEKRQIFIAMLLVAFRQHFNRKSCFRHKSSYFHSRCTHY